MAKLVTHKDDISWDNLPHLDLGIDISGDWIKLWEDFSRKHKLNVVLPYKDAKDRDEQSANAYIMLVNIIRIKNNGWIPDWKNSNQYKYYPYFYIDQPGKNGFAFGDAGTDASATSVGSRLCFFSRELAESTAREFLAIYRIYMTQN